MFQKDWLTRQLDMLATLSAHILALRRNGDNTAAQAVLDEACREVFGLEPALLALTPAEFLIDKTRSGNRIDGHRALLLATLLREQAAAGEWAADSPAAERAQQALLQRSLAVFLACAEDGTLPPEHAQVYDIRQTLAVMDDEWLSPELKYRLFHFLEDSGRYAEAEDMLFDLIESSAAPEALIAEGIAFYEWLLEQDDADLAAGNLPRDEVTESLARLRAM